MFVGHYGVSFAAKRTEPSVPLWVLFVAVQFLDVLWAPFVLLGIERVRIVRHFTASNALDLYYMPYTHGLPAAVAWSVIAALLYRFTARRATGRASAVVGAAVFSHWILDLIVHVPDLPLWGNRAKVGLGLWNLAVPAFFLESAILVGGLVLYLRRGARRPAGLLVFGAALMAIQAASTFLVPPPSSGRAFAVTALAAYAAFALIIWWIEDRKVSGPEASNSPRHASVNTASGEGGSGSV